MLWAPSMPWDLSDKEDAWARGSFSSCSAPAVGLGLRQTVQSTNLPILSTLLHFPCEP